MNRFVALVVALIALAVLLGFNVVSSHQRPGRLPPEPERVEHHGPTLEEKLQVHIRNLSFEKEGRTLAAARNLGNLGARAKAAIPRLEELIAAEPDSDGFPNERQKAAFRDALAKIRTALEEKRG